MAKLVIGAVLVLFGMRWLRKAMSRAAGVIPLHDEIAHSTTKPASLPALKQDV